MEMVRFSIGALLVIIGLVLEIISVFGVYKLNYVLSRMHAAAIGDTGALFCFMVGLMVLNGFNMFTLKLFFTIVFFWIGSAATSHVLSRMVIRAEEDEARKYCEFEDVNVESVTDKE